MKTWVPMWWPCGPLEIERGEKRHSFGTRERDALNRWADPGLLDLLEGTPVSCLVVTWAHGSPADEGQQQVLVPLIAAARARGLAVVGWVGDEADLGRASVAASSGGLAALATESEDPVDGIPVLRFREGVGGAASTGGFVGLTGGVWPGLKVDREADFDAWSGVTGPPWVDSNAWSVRLARELIGPETMWLSFDPPVSRVALPPGPYVQAIADAEVYGARWVVSLDPRLRYDLSRGRRKDVWGQISRTLSFFEERRAWADYRPVGRLGVVSDFSGPNEFLSFEVVNLLTRQSSAYRIVQKKQALTAPYGEMKAVLYVDEAPPDADLVRRLYAFAEGGGTLITPPGWEARGEPLPAGAFPRFHVSRYGQGRLAVASEELSDPYLVAADAQVLMSHRHDPVRVFNPGTARFHYATREDGRRGVLQVFRYARRPFETQVSVWFRKPWASAHTWRMEAEGAESSERAEREPGVEFPLPPVSAYCAVEVSA